MVLVLAEKEEVAKAISAALPNPEQSQKERGLIKQGDYWITWCSGHMLRLKEPEDYDPNYKQWSIEQLPINFKNWGVKPIEEDKNNLYRLENIKKWLQQADTVIHAGDPDQEGQLLVDEVLRLYKYKKQVLRLNTSDTTVPGLRAALNNMSDNRNFESAGWAAYARGVADLMVGVNISRLFTKLNNILLTIGRVQTPTLGLVVVRDALIEGHQKIVYYTINATITLQNGTTFTAKYEPNKQDPNLVDGRILSKAYAEQIAANLEGYFLQECTITKKEVLEKPPLPFNMVKIQSYCGKHFNMSLEETMQTTQSLRDTHSAITYNRSDCQYLTMNHYAEAPQTMATVIQNIRFKPKALDMTIKSDCFNDDKVKLHFAIIPQNVQLDLSKLSEKERNVYLAIVKYYMAQFMPPAQKELTKFEAPLPDGGKLTATSTHILKPGYRAIFRESEPDDESGLSTVPAGKYQAKASDAQTAEKETKPPARYTQISLAEDMTCIAKYVTDPRIKRLLKEKDKDSEEDNGSIGTVATRTGIITDLIKRGFLAENEKKQLISTPIGRELYRILPDEVKKPDMTAEWWYVCEQIVDGTAQPDALQNSVLASIQNILNNRDSYPKADETIVAKSKRYGGKEPVGVCPRCQGPVVESTKGFGCLNWKNGCKFVLWKNSKLSLLKDITITEAMARKLLSGGSVKTEKLYIEKDDRHTKGTLTLDDSKKAPYGASLSVTFTKSRAGKKGSTNSK